VKKSSTPTAARQFMSEASMAMAEPRRAATKSPARPWGRWVTRKWGKTWSALVMDLGRVSPVRR
jgi:hypothetical protein